MRALIMLVVFAGLVDSVVVFRRVCSYCRDKPVFKFGHNYAGFYQKHNTGALEGYPCLKDKGHLMKCATSCIQAQFTDQESGKTYFYRDCGTYLLQEFGHEKFNLSYTQYAMILTDIDDIGNTWVFKFCNKEKCLHPPDYEIDQVDRREKAERQKASCNATSSQRGSLLNFLSGEESSKKLLVVAFAVVLGMVIGGLVAKVIKLARERHHRRSQARLPNVEYLLQRENEPVARISASGP